MNKREFKKRLEQIKKNKFWASDINGGIYVIREFIENFTSFSKNIIKVSPNKNRTLYKYLVCDRQNLENLKNDSIFFRYPKGFKTDEYDSVFKLSEKLKESTYSTSKELYELLNRYLQKNIFVTCFTENKSENQMWEKYSDDYSGYCIEYSLDYFYKNYIEKKINDNDNYTNNIAPVVYEKDIFDVADYYLDEYSKELLIEKNFKNIIVPVLFFTTLTKRSEYFWENEWRWFEIEVKNPNEKSIYTEDGMIKIVGKPKAIYLGKKMSKENKKEIISIAKEKNIKIYEMIDNEKDIIFRKIL